LSWFKGYTDVFSFQKHSSIESMVEDVSRIYREVFEKFRTSRHTESRSKEQIQKELRMFGFDYLDIDSDTPKRFYSKFAIPPQYSPMPTSGVQFPERSEVIWPKHHNGNPRRFLASYIRNSSAHGHTVVNDGIVTIENRESGIVPNFRIFLPWKEYLRLIVGSLKYFADSVLNVMGEGNALSKLKTLEYGKLLGFFENFQRNLKIISNGAWICGLWVSNYCKCWVCCLRTFRFLR
jgi:hypothetical protein